MKISFVLGFFLISLSLLFSASVDAQGQVCGGDICAEVVDGDTVVVTHQSGNVLGGYLIIEGGMNKWWYHAMGDHYVSYAGGQVSVLPTSGLVYDTPYGFSNDLCNVAELASEGGVVFYLDGSCPANLDLSKCTVVTPGVLLRDPYIDSSVRINELDCVDGQQTVGASSGRDTVVVTPPCDHVCPNGYHHAYKEGENVHVYAGDGILLIDSAWDPIQHSDGGEVPAVWVHEGPKHTVELHRYDDGVWRLKIHYHQRCHTEAVEWESGRSEWFVTISAEYPTDSPNPACSSN